jgi:hypothetical protein
MPRVRYDATKVAGWFEVASGSFPLCRDVTYGR